ncbi:hypothetical protein Droror1_Dr00010462 [Drosera rotundifolia]
MSFFIVFPSKIRAWREMGLGFPLNPPSNKYQTHSERSHSIDFHSLDLRLRQMSSEDFDDDESWWKSNSYRYEVLSLMARDFLAMPMLSTSPESFLTEEGCVLDLHRSYLPHQTLDAMICAQDLLRASSPMPRCMEENLAEECTTYRSGLANLMRNHKTITVYYDSSLYESRVMILLCH